MKTIGNTAIIGVDHGYGNCKHASGAFPTGIIAYDSKPTFDGNVLLYKGAHYKIGEGHKSFTSDKTADIDFYVMTLAAIARELNHHGMTSADVHIAAGVPLMWVRTQRDSFREYLLQNESAEFTFKDKDFKIRIVGCNIFPQCYPAILENLGGMDGVNMVADIGNGTMNAMMILNRQVSESKCWTEKLGVNQCMIAAKNAVMDRFGVKVEDMIVQNVIRYGTADIGTEYLDCIINSAKSYAADIFTALRKYEYNSDLMRLYVVGGGGCIVKNFAEYNKDRVIINDDICATAKGYEQLALGLLKKNGGANG
jgi:plasmid segregation protein ParM